IFAPHELVVEVKVLGDGAHHHVDIRDHFLAVKPQDIPSLTLDNCLNQILLRPAIPTGSGLTTLPAGGSRDLATKFDEEPSREGN
ncbi:MAG: hypothetical protein ACR2NP_17295, partial [Pirellulaceae bacterium]